MTKFFVIQYFLYRICRPDELLSTSVSLSVIKCKILVDWLLYQDKNYNLRNRNKITVQILFSSHLYKSVSEKFMIYIHNNFLLDQNVNFLHFWLIDIMVKRQILVKIQMSTHWPVFVKIKNAYFSGFCSEHADGAKLELDRIRVNLFANIKRSSFWSPPLAGSKLFMVNLEIISL